MSVAIIIGTHGHSAEQLLKTAEMILGQQDNVAFIDFVPGENTEILEQKYQSKIAELKTDEGILFLVDMWGGSPFNAANSVTHQTNNSNVVTGINIPMLIEIFMAREDNQSLNDLVSIGISSGKAGIKALKQIEQSITPQKASMATPESDTSPLMASGDEHMNIKLVRIDDRLIHGQVATRWSKEGNVSRIIVINDEVAANEVRKSLLSQAAPPGVSAHVVGIEKALRVYNNPKYANDNVILLFTNPQDILLLVERGIKLESINIGGMAFKQGKRVITDAISVDDNDVETFKKLHLNGIELEVRKVPSDKKINLMSLINKE